MAVASLVLLGCRPGTVTLGFEPEVGDSYRYRYEIDLVVTRTVVGESPEVTEISSTLTSTQEVLDATPEGVLVQVSLRSDGAAPTTAVVLLDRAGSLRAIEGADGLTVDEVGVPAAGRVLPSRYVEPPVRPLSPGDRWAIADGGVVGEGRLERLGVIDGQDVAVVTASLVQALRDDLVVSDSAVALAGDLRSRASTTFDLVDGAVREGSTASTGRVEVEISPPPGLTGAPVSAFIDYELRVRTVRLG